MSYKIKDELKLHVETALDNANPCKELLTLRNLVEFGLVPKEEKMSNSILARLKKCSNIIDTPTNSSTPPKNPRVDQTASFIRILPLPPSESGNVIDKTSLKDSVVLILVSGRTQSARLRE